MSRPGLLVMVLAGLLLAGCGASGGTPTGAGSISASSTPTPLATPAATTAGPGSSASGRAALRMTLPSNWSVVDMNLAALQGMVSALGASNPQMAAMMNQLITSGAYKQLNFFAFEYNGLTPIGNVDTSLGVATNGLSLDAAAPVLQGEITQAGATNVASTHMALPVGDVLLVSYDLSVTGANGAKISESGRAYYYEANGDLYSATFTCMSPSTTTCLADSAAIAQTLTLAP